MYAAATCEKAPRGQREKRATVLRRGAGDAATRGGATRRPADAERPAAAAPRRPAPRQRGPGKVRPAAFSKAATQTA